MDRGGLHRSLGLYPTVMISMGAMIGSGIFVLPALGFTKAGPAVILAYVLAAVVVLPATLSKAEMATAMPESGGTYLYVDRALGPMMGTVAGFGAWFSLVFKTSFALMGLGAYLVLIAPGANGLIKGVALGLAVAIVVVNVSGTELSGKIQTAIVSGVLVGLAAYTIDASHRVDPDRFTPFLTEGSTGIVTAAAVVFVSFAGVTKIASIAEEVDDPGRNLPRAMLGSLAIMTVVYVAVVAVAIGLADPDVLRTGGPGGTASLTPVADGAGAVFGGYGTVIVAIIAIVALTSMANAGVLSSSRFPLAMSRDALLPPSLSVIDRRFTTPRNSIVLTGAVLFVLIAFVPVIELAKLASAFQLLVFSIENVSLIAFRLAAPTSYRPAFVAPGYPYVQVFGVLAGMALLTQMGALPILGAIGITIGGLAIYAGYGRFRTDRTGAIGTVLDRWRTNDSTAMDLD